MGESYVVPAGATLRAGRHTLPAWRRAMTAGHWGTVGDTPAAINPYSNPLLNPLAGNAPWNGSTTMAGNRFASIITAWCGGAWHESRRQLYISGGGHGDYAGNEIISLALGEDAPVWALTSPPTGSTARTWSGWTATAGILNNGGSGTYQDGRLRAVHTYWNLSVCRDGYLWNGGGSQFIAGNYGVWAARFDPLLKDYIDRSSDIRIFPYSTVNAWGIWVYDSLRHRFLRSATGLSRVYPFNISTLSWGNQIGYEVDRGAYCAARYDAARDIVLCRGNSALSGGSHNEAELEILDFAHGAHGHAVVSGPVGFSWGNWHGRTGMDYYPPWDCYLIWPSGSSSLYRLDPPPVGSASYLAGWSLSEVPATAGAPTVGATNGTFGRFWASAALRCSGVINSVNEPMQVFALE